MLNLKKTLPILLKVSLYSLSLLTFLLSCNLFNAPVDKDYLIKIDNEIAWSNAPRLTVNVAFPPEWGVSPQAGENRCFDAKYSSETPRAGYPFNVEFTSNSSYYFNEWLAFEFNEDFRLEEITGLDFDDAKKRSLKEGVEITKPAETHSGAFVSSVTLSTGKKVTLVPFCSDRPRITQINPPNNSGFSYTRGQEIRIWIDLGFPQDKELDFSEDQITIFGQNFSDGEPWEDSGELKAYYEKPLYEASNKRIVIKPNEEKYPPGNLTITVTVGIDLLGVNGRGMAAPVSFSYRTSSEIVTRAYKASNVWAIHNPNIPTVESFFSQTAPSDRDRRLRKNSSGNYEITLYFGVSRSMGEIEDPEPDSLRIAKIYYADLSGTLFENFDDDGNYTFDVMENTPNSAGSIYRQMNPSVNPLGVYYYKSVYTFYNNPAAGIYRLVVLPLHSDKVPADEWKEAVDEGRFVTVVIDDKPPGGSGTLLLSGHSFINDDGIYAYTSMNRFINISANFQDIKDNATEDDKEGGIPLNQATPNLPWTMDERNNLFWQWQIIDSGKNLLDISEDWLAMGTNPAPLDVFLVIGEPLGESKVCTIEVMFKDALGNESVWEEMGRIMHDVPPDFATVTSWRAEYRESNNTILIQWSLPSVMDGVSIRITDANGAITNQDKKGEEFHAIFNVPKLTGHGNTIVSLRYTIELNAYKEEGGGTTTLPLPEPIIIYNYPGMVSSEANPLVEIANATQLGNIRTSGLGNTNKHYVLTSDIDLSSVWTPIGSGTGSSAFQGKFYGNGKTITVSNGFTFTSGTSNYGIFGYIQNALIRDIEVFYSSTISVSSSGNSYLGGLVGLAAGSSSLIDCEVKGGTGVVLQHTGQSSKYTGGIAGSLGGSSQIIKCISSINIKADTTSTSTISNFINYTGGLVGDANGNTTIQKCYATGEVQASSRDGVLYVGGLVGNSDNRVTIEQSWASGNVMATRTAESSSAISAGGLIAYNSSTNIINNCYALGNVMVDSNNSGTNHTYSGGLIGYSSNANIEFGFATGSAEIKSSHTDNIRAGGIAGNIASGRIGNLAALGSPITVTYVRGTGINIHVFRIASSQGIDSLANNHALDTIMIGTSNGGYGSEVSLYVPDSEIGEHRWNGANVRDTTRRTAGFWTDTMGFDTAVWDTTDVVTRGYPVLKDVGGE